MKNLFIATLMWFGLAAGSATAATYLFDVTVDQNYGSKPDDTPRVGPASVKLGGSLTTDGTIGALTLANILSWDVTVTTNGVTGVISSSDPLDGVQYKVPDLPVLARYTNSFYFTEGALITTAEGLNFDASLNGAFHFSKRADLRLIDEDGNFVSGIGLPTFQGFHAYPTNGGSSMRFSTSAYALNGTSERSVEYGGGYATAYLTATPVYQIATIAAVPLPATGLLSLAALGLIAGFRRSRNKH